MSSESMTKTVFLDKLADILEMDPGSLQGDETLESIGWDSLCSLSFIVMVDEEFGLNFSGSQVMGAKTVSDLVGLMEDRVAG